MSSMSRQEVIAKLDEGLVITPFDLTRLGPDTYDVALGQYIQIETYGGEEGMMILDLAGTNEGNFFVLRPGEFILAHTEEVITLPPDVSANLSLRSTWARAGLNHSLAGHVDPGWHGSLTLELKNLKSRHVLALWRGLVIAQLEFIQKRYNSDRDYSTPGHHYYGDTVVQGPIF